MRFMSYKSAVVTLLVWTGILSAAPAVPRCEDGSASQWIAYGSEGCRVGQFTIKNVAWNSIEGELNGVMYNEVSSDDVVLSVTRNKGKIGLDFYSSMFSVAGDNQGIKAYREYLIDPPPPIFDDFMIEMDANSPQGEGSATITALLCAGDTLDNSCSGGERKELSVYYFGNGDKLLQNMTTFARRVNIVDIRLEIELLANGDSSQINGGRQNTAVVVPEPGAFVLVGAGGLVLAAVRRIRNS